MAPPAFNGRRATDESRARSLSIRRDWLGAVMGANGGIICTAAIVVGVAAVSDQAVLASGLALVFAAALACARTGKVRTGAAAFADWRADAPGSGATSCLRTCRWRLRSTPQDRSPAM
ncbi:hypothetical protein [Ramlibacter sp.]|uniref:hypothetical protein n=1 Tax=Ramlibacter sp. TaxID=1917967 RepID=UPI00261151FC|nr:hypothetical protein [Ramlibacter sp.]